MARKVVRMTENEAKEYIRSRICNEKGIQRLCRDNCMYGEGQCAFQIAIQALEEIQQYRAIGLTPTMVQDTIKARDKAQKRAIENAHIVDEYREIGTIEEFAHSKRMLHIAELASDHIEKEKQEIRAKAIDEFATALIPRLTDAIYQKDVESMTNLINGVARELKAGGKNE